MGRWALVVAGVLSAVACSRGEDSAPKTEARRVAPTPAPAEAEPEVEPEAKAGSESGDGTGSEGSTESETETDSGTDSGTEVFADPGEGAYLGRLPGEPLSPSLAPLPEGAFPKGCSVALSVVRPEPIASPDVSMRMPESGPVNYCDSLHTCASCDCAIEGPWFVAHEDLRVALLIPLAPGRFAEVPDLGWLNDGTEESEIPTDGSTSSLAPMDGWLEFEIAEQDCGDDDEEDGLCGLSLLERRQVALLALADGHFLQLEVSVDVGPEDSGADMVSLVLEDGTLSVEACGRTRELPVPKAWLDRFAAIEGEGEDEGDGEVKEEPATTEHPGPVPSPEAVVEAGKRCGKGWKAFAAEDYDRARIDLDASLEVLERSKDDGGLRRLGACLYSRGRLAEVEGEVDAAADYYRRSLAVRDNEVVEARLARLEGG